MSQVIEAEPMVLRPIEEHHAYEAFDLIDTNRDFLGQWLPWVQRQHRMEDTLFMIQRATSHFSHHRGMLGGIWHGERLVGMVGHQHVDLENGSAELTIWLDEAHQGRGLAGRALQSIIHYSFGVMHLRRVEMRCPANNPRVLALAQRLGFAHEGTLRKAASINGRTVDVLVYGLLIEDWLAR